MCRASQRVTEKGCGFFVFSSGGQHVHNKCISFYDLFWGSIRSLFLNLLLNRARNRRLGRLLANSLTSNDLVGGDNVGINNDRLKSDASRNIIRSSNITLNIANTKDITIGAKARRLLENILHRQTKRRINETILAIRKRIGIHLHRLITINRRLLPRRRTNTNHRNANDGAGNKIRTLSLNNLRLRGDPLHRLSSNNKVRGVLTITIPLTVITLRVFRLNTKNRIRNIGTIVT